MKLRALLLALIAWAALSAPALAAWVVTHKGSNIGTASAAVTGQSYASGSIVGLAGISRGSAGSDVLTITSSVSGAVDSAQIYICAVGGNASKTFIGWAYASGGSENFTLTNSAGSVTALLLHTFEITGGAAASPEDTGARACATAQGTSPTVTSGALAESGELLIGVTARSGSSLGYTEDAAWTQIGTENGNGNVREAAAYKAAPSTSAVTHNPTVTQTNSSTAVLALKAAAASSSSARRGMLLGVGP